MVLLPESSLAFLFQAGIGRIEAAYRASVATMEGAYKEAAASYNEYEASGEDDTETDEDGIMTKSTSAELNFEALNAAVAVEVVREAFIASAFHYWERAARSWSGIDKRPTYAKLRAASAMRYPISPDLDALNLLNNILKHSGHDKDGEITHPVLKLPVTNAAVEHAFEVVKSSGPQI